MLRLVLWGFLAVVFAALPGGALAETTLLNVSYDPTREFYADFNQVFAEKWRKETGETLNIRTSNGGSGAQARAVIEGLEADVVTLGISADIDQIAAKAGLLPADWQTRLPEDSTPYTSTIVFLVRKGNPKGIHDWADLLKPGVQVITPNPKTSSGGRWNFMAALAYALKANGGDAAKAQAYVGAVYARVPVLDTGARGSTITFVQRGQGDVLLAWENEAFLATQKLAQGEVEIVVPSISMLAEPPVALVDKNVDRHGTRKPAEAYLKFLYTPQGQELAAKHFYRPRDPAVLAKYASIFPQLEQVSIDQFGGWKKVQPQYFGDGGVFDQIYKPAAH